MFTTGSKLLIGSAIAATVAAILYGVTTDGVMGTIGLASAAVALSGLAAVNAYTRDANVLETDDATVAASAAAARRPANSMWPLGVGVGVTLLGLGLVTTQTVFTLGAIVLVAAGGEWAVQAWAERASADDEYNEEVRLRILGPLEFPILGAVSIGILVYAFSRIMLWLSKTNTVILFSVVAAIVLAIAAILALRPSVRSGTVGGVLTVAALLVIGGGVAAGIDGQRETHHLETTEELSHEGICESPDEFEADENASQTVAMTAAAAATVYLQQDGTLTFDVPGPVEAGAPGLQLPRSNPSNIIFRNHSDHERRLSLSLGTTTTTDESGNDETEPNLTCTTLVEGDGGAQLLTVTIAEPSFAFPDGYAFFIPGVDTAILPVVVP